MSGGFFEKKKVSRRHRDMMFFALCIPARLLLATMAYRLETHEMFAPISILLSLISIKMNLNDSEVWWDRRYHLCNAISILIVSITGFTRYVKYMLVSDVFYGLVTFLTRAK